MKYIVLFVILLLVFFTKPWEISFAGNSFLMNRDSIAPSSQNKTFSKYPLQPIHLLVSNLDSELAETQRFDQVVERFMKKWDIKGASFALMKEDKLIYSKGYGYADKEANISMDVKHIFRVASVSKLITAIGIMKLEEEGKLHLDDIVFGENGILNDSCFLNIKDPRSNQITIEHLLRHQGGFTNIHGDPMFCPIDVAQKMNVPPPADLNTMIGYVLSQRLGYTPGTYTDYSNIGYGILSRVIEKVTGKSYEAYIKEQVLIPAGCSGMYLGYNLEKNRYPNEVKYYEPANAGMIYACDGSNQMVPRSNGGNNIEELYGAGGWIASPAELLRLLATIDGDPGIADILKPETIVQMTDGTKPLPIGWISVDAEGDWSRTGTLAGTSAMLKKQKNGYSWGFITNTSTWRGSKFTHDIERMMTIAITSTVWPDRNLFELQDIDYDKLLVVQ